MRRFLETTYLLWPVFILSDFTDAWQEQQSRRDPGRIALSLAMCANACSDMHGILGSGKAKGSDFYELCTVLSCPWLYFRFTTTVMPDVNVNLDLELRQSAPTYNWSSLHAIQVSFCYLYRMMLEQRPIHYYIHSAF